MKKLWVLVALCCAAGCSVGPTDRERRDLASYDQKYDETRWERQAFDESDWDQIETELRERRR